MSDEHYEVDDDLEPLPEPYPSPDDEPVVIPPVPRDEAVIPAGNSFQGQRELYGALLDGFDADERQNIEGLMSDNMERLRGSGDGYVP